MVYVFFQCRYLNALSRTAVLGVSLAFHKETNEASLAFAILRGRVKRVLQKRGNSSSLWVKWLRRGDIGSIIISKKK